MTNSRMSDLTVEETQLPIHPITNAYELESAITSIATLVSRCHGPVADRLSEQLEALLQRQLALFGIDE